MSAITKSQLKTGAILILTGLPPRFLDGLPKADQKAIQQVIGKPVRFCAFDSLGRVELQFTDSRGVIHFIYVDPVFITQTTAKRRRKSAPGQGPSRAKKAHTEKGR